MSTRMSAGRVRATYEFIQAQRATFSVQTLCRVLDVAPSGYYAGLKQPLSHHASEDARLLRLIRAAFIASQGIYWAPRRALHGYRTRRWSVGKPAVLIPNLLKRQSR